MTPSEIIADRLLVIESAIRRCVREGFTGFLAHWMEGSTLCIQRCSTRRDAPILLGRTVTLLDMREAREALATLIAKSVDDEELP